MNLADAIRRLARWRLRLAEFDFQVEYRPGASHHAADAMSRLAQHETSVEAVDTELPVFALEASMSSPTVTVLEVENLIEEQQVDSDCVTGRERLCNDQLWDIDQKGVLGQLRSSGAFEALLQRALLDTPICPVYTLAEGGSDLRRGEQGGLISHGGLISRSVRVTEPSPPGHGLQVLVASRPSDVPELSPIRIEELIREQASDELCKSLIGLTSEKSLFDVDERGLLIRVAPLDGVRQIVVPKALLPKLLHLEHYPKTTGHPGISRMLRTIRRNYFWPSMAADVVRTVKQCDTCSRNRVNLSKRTNPLKLFPANAPLESVAMDILGPLSKTRHGNRFLLVIADRYTKITRTVPLRTITALTVAQAFCEHWVYIYGPPVSLLSDNGPQFAAKFFQAVCTELGIKKLFTTAYHPQANGQVERYNRTLVQALRAYVSKRLDDWETTSRRH